MIIERHFFDYPNQEAEETMQTAADAWSPLTVLATTTYTFVEVNVPLIPYRASIILLLKKETKTE